MRKSDLKDLENSDSHNPPDISTPNNNTPTDTEEQYGWFIDPAEIEEEPSASKIKTPTKEEIKKFNHKKPGIKAEEKIKSTNETKETPSASPVRFSEHPLIWILFRLVGIDPNNPVIEKKDEGR